MPRFDSRVIQQYAQELYDRAESLVWKAIVAGALVGALLGWVLSLAMRVAHVAFLPPLVVVGIVAAVAALKAATGAEREVFRLRLEAQQALCQLMIEQNTGLAAKHLQEINLRGARVRTASPDHFA